ncbi:MAG TPA: ABC transporter ATP-binding protein [Anaerolineae bacterium]|nr:ABC transporter ATP-binding protein [Anaerolineae bacterium]
MRPTLEFDQVYYRYAGQKKYALDGLTLTLPPGENIALIGRNGAGKSTFFLHCNGLYRPQAGQVRFAGQPLLYERQALKQLRRHVGIVFQNADDQLFSASVAQDISFGPLNLGLSQAEARHRVQMAADLCNIADLLDRPTHALSGGEKARVALAGVLAMDPDILISDELLSSLDPWVRLRMLDIFAQLRERGKTVIMATHDLKVVRRWASYVVVMDAGRAAFAGTPEHLLADQVLLTQTGLAQVWDGEI